MKIGYILFAAPVLVAIIALGGGVRGGSAYGRRGVAAGAVEASARAVLADEGFRVCRVDLNQETVLYGTVPFADFQKAIVPALRDTSQGHAGAYIKYSIPFKTFWQLTGFGPFAALRAPGCGEGCQAGCVCFPPVQFERVPNTNRATFKWAACPNTPPLRGSASVGTELTYDYNWPAEFAGEAYIAADIVSLFFTSERLPRLKVTDKNYNGAGSPQVVFEGDLRCIGTSATWAAIRQSKTGAAIPELPLYLETQ